MGVKVADTWENSQTAHKVSTIIPHTVAYKANKQIERVVNGFAAKTHIPDKSQR